MYTPDTSPFIPTAPVFPSALGINRVDITATADTTTRGVSLRVTADGSTISQATDASSPMGENIPAEIVIFCGLIVALEEIREMCLDHLESLLYATTDDDLPWRNTSFRSVLRTYPRLSRPGNGTRIPRTRASIDEFVVVAVKLITVVSMIY
jgi:hypothetical protein